jgi:predicted outer membrane repeat protein
MRTSDGKRRGSRFRFTGQTAAHKGGVIAGNGKGSLVFSTFEVVFTKQHQKLDLISGTIVDYEPNAFVDVYRAWGSELDQDSEPRLLADYGSRRIV